MSSWGGQAVDRRHCTRGCAMTAGASASAIVARAAVLPAVARNLRRGSIPSPCCLALEELMVGALGDLIPRPQLRLDPREGCADLPGHRALLGLLADDVDGQPAQRSQDGHREL